MSASSLAAKFDSSLAKPNTRSNLVIGSQINISSGGGGGGGGGERDNGAVYKLAKKTISPVFTTQSIFLPKLPPKLFGKSIKETEYIDYMGGFFIRPQSSLQVSKTFCFLIYGFNTFYFFY